MTETKSLEEAIHTKLDETPDDWTTRLVLADLLEEQEREDEAFCQRWMVENKKRPCKVPEEHETFMNSKGWHWWSHIHTLSHLEYSLLPEYVCEKIPTYFTETRQEAESNLMKALKASK